MSGRFLVLLALAAGIGTAAAAQDTTPVDFKPGAAGRSAGVIPQRGGRTWPGIAMRDAAASRPGRHRLLGPTLRDARADRTRTRVFRGGRAAAIRVARSRARAAGMPSRRGHALRPRPAIPDHGARHDGAEIAAVGDLEFGIDDHRHGRRNGGLERHRDRDRFRVPQHRRRHDRFIAPKHRFGRKHDFGRKRLGRGRQFEHRRSLGRRLRCDTAIGSSVLAFC